MDAIRYLKNLSCFTVVSFDQCVVGAAGRKPTTLLLLRLPAVRDVLLKRGNFGRCNHPHGEHTALIGREVDGTFHTAKAKVYIPVWLEQSAGRRAVQCSHAMGRDGSGGRAAPGLHAVHGTKVP